jgi:uncharacterized repeat protein (TIGR01451 family)
MVAPGQVGVGDVLTYSILVLNEGFKTSTETQLCDTMAQGTAYVPGSAGASGGMITDGCPLCWSGTVAPGLAISLTYQVTVVNSGKIVNAAVITDQNGLTTLLTAESCIGCVHLPLILKLK